MLLLTVQLFYVAVLADLAEVMNVFDLFGICF